MRTILIGLLALTVAVPSLSAQNNNATTDDLRGLREQMNTILQSLEQTRSELRDARMEIKELHTQLDHLADRSTTPPATGGGSADLRERVATVEETQRIADSRIAQLHQTKIESASKYRVKMYGLVLFNAGLNRGFVDDIDTPRLAAGPVQGQNAGSISSTFRQTLLRLQVSGPKLAGARTSADLQFDFYGGSPDTLDGVTTGLARMRIARAQFDWTKWSLTFGQDQPFISPLSPSSIATVGTPALGYSGNLWTWTPQIVAARRWSLSEQSTITTQFGLLDPLNGEEPEAQFSRKPEAGERSRVPALALRQSISRMIGERELKVGVGGYYARQDYGFDRTVDGWAGTLDYEVPLSKYLAVSGEFFRGRALGGLWGAIERSAVFAGPQGVATTPVIGVNTVGGWSQLKFTPHPQWEFNAVAGTDNPYASDVRKISGGPYRPLLRNGTAMFNIIQHPRSNVSLALEYRHLQSISLDSQKRTAEHVNLGVGIQF